MRNKTMYVLHEYGANSHFNALVELASRNGYRTKFRVLGILTKLKKVLVGEYSIKNWLFDVLFLIFIPFYRSSKIVIGLAPYNTKLKLVMKLLKRHEVFYFTSFTRWDGMGAPHRLKSKDDFTTWKYFMANYAKHIFAVSNKTKVELLRNGFSKPNKITVVYHSYNIAINALPKNSKENTFIYVGRLIEEKGIRELLKIFSSKPNAKLVIIGKGPEEIIVNQYVIQYDNIEYVGYINGLRNIIPFYNKTCFLLLNSHRVDGWEELFGITIIEGMSCGCVPITTDHTGPREIITEDINGIICREGEIAWGINRAINMTDQEYFKMREKAIECGNKYRSSIVADRWKAVFE